MEHENKYLVEVYYKVPHKRKRVFSFISKDGYPAPLNLWAYIDRGIEQEFNISPWNESSLDFVVTFLPDQ